MPTIPEFPQDLLDQHHHWHNPAAHPGAGPGRTHAAGTPGGGLEFLTFHRNFQAQALGWYNAHPFTQTPFTDPAQKAQLVAPWTTVPPELQGDSDWGNWSGDAARLDSGTPDFASADELGTFIELGIHNNFLHGASAAVFNEPEVGTLHSPHSTLFYKIHGLVDYWWSQWQRRHKRVIKELMKEFVREIDHKRFLLETKEFRPEVAKNRIDEVKRLGDEVKAAGLEGFDDPREIVVDPAVELNVRIARIEQRVFPRAATFIEPAERPDVGGHAERPGHADGDHERR
jgi:hypothetical protein